MRAATRTTTFIATTVAVAFHKSSLVEAKLRPVTNLVSDMGIGGDHLSEHLRQHHPDRFLELTSASLLGNVALTIVSGTPAQDHAAATGTAGAPLPVGTSVYGPFEAGFGTRQDNVIRNQFGCTSDTTHCYSEGGLDVGIAEAICARNCNIELPRYENNVYYGMLDSCGGHTEYHFHRDMNCLYSQTDGDTHSPRIADIVLNTGGGGGGGRPPRRQLQEETQSLYGKWEDYSMQELPLLDACNGQYGFTPESPDVEVYHYHVTEHAPFSIGCFGPNDDGSLVSVEQCRALYDGCDDSADIEIFIVSEDGADKTIPYQPWCPCYDRSGLGVKGAGLNVGNTTPTRGWYRKAYENGAWATVATGVISDLGGVYENGISIVFDKLTAETASPVVVSTDLPVASPSTGIPFASSSDSPVASTTTSPVASAATISPVSFTTDSPVTVSSTESPVAMLTSTESPAVASESSSLASPTIGRWVLYSLALLYFFVREV